MTFDNFSHDSSSIDVLSDESFFFAKKLTVVSSLNEAKFENENERIIVFT
jgi:hypothetical protein